MPPRRRACAVDSERVPSRPGRTPWHPPPRTETARREHADRHQRLPAPAGRHPGVRARPRRAPAAWVGRRLRAAVDGVRGVRRAPAVPGGAPPHDGSCCRCRRSPARAARLVRRARAATRSCSGRRRRWACSRPRCAQAGRARIVMLTHGHEAAWAGSPPAARLLRRIGARRRRRHLPRRLHPSTGSPARSPGRSWYGSRPAWTPRCSGPGRAAPRSAAALGLGDRPVVVCVSRLVPRKGQDTLIRAWPGCCARSRTRCCCSSAAGRTAGRWSA